MKILPDGSQQGDIVIINENSGPISEALVRGDISRPFVLLSSGRGDPRLMSLVNDYENIGGLCRILYKPGGPSRLYATLKLCLQSLLGGKRFRADHSKKAETCLPQVQDTNAEGSESVNGLVPRPYDPDPAEIQGLSQHLLKPRLMTSDALPYPSTEAGSSEISQEYPVEKMGSSGSTISIGSSGILLKSSVGSITVETRTRVLVVEDNHILRDLLVKWLNTKGYEPRGAVDGRDGVRAFQSEGHFDIVLLDMSMPELDGVGATKEIRDIESRTPEIPGTRILALTGMSTLEDKRKAFEAGVDGYLVKPVAFKTLDEMFHRLGVS